jgi:hypothetical protein
LKILPKQATWDIIYDISNITTFLKFLKPLIS